jgi:hypothetical protein
MAKQVQFRRGTTLQHQSFIGVPAELTVDTDKNIVIVHDGSTVGGHPVAKSTNPQIKGSLTFLDSNQGVAFADGTVQKTAAKEAFWITFPGTLYTPIESGARFYPETNIILSTVVATIGTPSADEDIIIEIVVNGTDVTNQLTLLAAGIPTSNPDEFRVVGNFSSTTPLFSLPFNSYVSANVLQGNGANLTLKFNYIRS